MELPARSHSHIDGISSKSDLSRRDRNRSGSLGPDESCEDALRLGALTGHMNGWQAIDFTERVQETIHHHASQGDLQTAVSLVIVLGDRSKGMVNESVLEAWMLDYIGE